MAHPRHLCAALSQAKRSETYKTSNSANSLSTTPLCFGLSSLGFVLKSTYQKPLMERKREREQTLFRSAIWGLCWRLFRPSFSLKFANFEQGLHLCLLSIFLSHVLSVKSLDPIPHNFFPYQKGESITIQVNDEDDIGCNQLWPDGDLLFLCCREKGKNDATKFSNAISGSNGQWVSSFAQVQFSPILSFNSHQYILSFSNRLASGCQSNFKAQYFKSKNWQTRS